MTKDIHDLIKADMDRGAAEMRAILERDLYTTSPCVAAWKPRPLTWREKGRLRMRTVRRYLQTVWKALRGVDLIEPYEAD